MNLNLVIVVPVWERHEFSPAVLSSWPQCDPWTTLAVCSTDEDEAIYQGIGCETMRHPNQPLCGKFAAGVEHAFLRLHASHVVIMGSDTLANPALFRRLLTSARLGTEYAGFRGVWVADGRQAHYWEGYKGTRAGEPVGPGRMISRSIAEPVNFRVYGPDGHRNCDSSMTEILGLPTVLLDGMDYGLVSLKDEGSVTPMSSYGEPSECMDTADFFQFFHKGQAHIIRHLA